MTPDQLKEIINDCLDARTRLDACDHTAHHVWLEERIEAEKAFRDMCRAIGSAVLQWSVIGICTSLLYHLWPNIPKW